MNVSPSALPESVHARGGEELQGVGAGRGAVRLPVIVAAWCCSTRPRSARATAGRCCRRWPVRSRGSRRRGSSWRGSHVRARPSTARLVRCPKWPVVGDDVARPGGGAADDGAVGDDVDARPAVAQGRRPGRVGPDVVPLDRRSPSCRRHADPDVPPLPEITLPARRRRAADRHARVAPGRSHPRVAERPWSRWSRSRRSSPGSAGRWNRPRCLGSRTVPRDDVAGAAELPPMTTPVEVPWIGSRRSTEAFGTPLPVFPSAAVPLESVPM